MTEIILTGAGSVVGIMAGAVKALIFVVVVIVIIAVGSVALNWLFDWVMGKD